MSNDEEKQMPDTGSSPPTIDTNNAIPKRTSTIDRQSRFVEEKMDLEGKPLAEPRSPDLESPVATATGRKSEANTYNDDDDEEEPWFRQRRHSTAKEDPFGDESDSEVKYRTMAWWYVLYELRIL
jgi:hypothetical protein